MKDFSDVLKLAQTFLSIPAILEDGTISSGGYSNTISYLDGTSAQQDLVNLLFEFLHRYDTHLIHAGAVTGQETIVFTGPGQDLLAQSFANLGYRIIGGGDYGILCRNVGNEFLVFPSIKPDCTKSLYERTYFRKNHGDVKITPRVDLESYTEGRHVDKIVLLENVDSGDMEKLRANRGLRPNSKPFVWGEKSGQRCYERCAGKMGSTDHLGMWIFCDDKELLSFLKQFPLNFYEAYTTRRGEPGARTDPRTHSFGHTARAIIDKINF